MLYPIRNAFRDLLEVNSLWKFRVDAEKEGETERWYNGFESDIEIAVPGSWNEQLEELGLLHFVGLAWYSKNFFLPVHFSGKRIWLRIGSADFSSKIWVNGSFAGESEFGFLPNEVEVTSLAKAGQDNLIIIAVSNELDDDSIPQGITTAHYMNDDRIREETNPPARFDFSPFGGIHRPVIVYSTPTTCFRGLRVDTMIESSSAGRVGIVADIDGGEPSSFSAELFDAEGGMVCESTVGKLGSRKELMVDNCRFWSNEEPYLYTLKVSLQADGKIKDEYSLKIGIRELRIDGDKLLLNGKEVFLRGFGKHEDFAVIGRGLFFPLMIKDFELLKWINANSFRTSHYPYAEEVLSYADKRGILVLSEAPAVSLDLRYASSKALENHKRFIQRMVERDYNHPSVIIWSVGNEPNIVGDEGYYDGSGRAYWKEVFEFTRSLDESRPITVPNCTRAGLNDPVFEFSDVLAINRYYGWYEYPGNLQLAVDRLESDMEELHSRYNKPVLVTEFGADSLAGLHSTSLQMFTEEYQARIIEEYIRCIESKPYTIGEMVWNFADFRTPQHFRRVVLNLKGVFTRDREPKLSAFKLKTLWGARGKLDVLLIRKR